ncbi:unnamed protein product [Prunus armeniaca]
MNCHVAITDHLSIDPTIHKTCVTIADLPSRRATNQRVSPVVGYLKVYQTTKASIPWPEAR